MAQRSYKKPIKFNDSTPPLGLSPGYFWCDSNTGMLYAAYNNQAAFNGSNEVLFGVTPVKATTPSTSVVTANALPLVNDGDLLTIINSNLTRVPVGSTGQILGVFNGLPAWTTPSASTAALLTTKGDLLAYNGTIALRFGIGSNGKVLTADSTSSTGFSWQTVSLPSSILTTGQLLTANASGDFGLPIGTSGQVLTVSGGLPAWADQISYTPPINQEGDIFIYQGGVPARLPIGGNGKYLSVINSVLTWSDPASLTSPLVAPGDIYIRGIAGDTRLAKGLSGQLLSSTASGLAWVNSFANPMTAVGDLITNVSVIVGTGAEAVTVLEPSPIAIGTTGQVLTVTAGHPAWAAPFTPLTTAGDLYIRDTTGDSRLGIGSNGQYLTITGGALTWQTPTFLLNPMTTAGDLIVGGAAGAPTALPKGSANQVLAVNDSATGLTWTNTSPLTTPGDVYVLDASGKNARLPIGTNGEFLGVSGGILAWLTPGSAFVNPMTAAGQIIVANSGGTPTALAPGFAGQVLTVGSSGTTLLWSNNSPLTTLGDLYIFGASGNARLPIGTAGQVLTVNGAGTTVTWANSNPLTTLGDIYVYGSSGPTRLAMGGNGQALGVSGGNLTWFNPLANPMSNAGDLIVGGTSGVATPLSIGTAGQVLTVNSSATGVFWANSFNPMTAVGQMIVGGSGGVPTALPLGSIGDVLAVNSTGTGVHWTPPVNATSVLTNPGDIYIRGSSADTRLPIGTTGQVLTVIAGEPAWVNSTGGAPTITYSALWNPFVHVTTSSSTPRLPGDFLVVDTTGGPISVTLPTTASVSADSRPVKILDAVGTTTSSTTGFAINNVTVFPSGGQTINGAASYVLNVAATCPEFSLIGINWKITGGVVG